MTKEGFCVLYHWTSDGEYEDDWVMDDMIKAQNKVLRCFENIISHAWLHRRFLLNVSQYVSIFFIFPVAQ